MPERDLGGFPRILSYFSRSERQQRRLEKFRRELPTAVVAEFERSSQGDVLLRALKCMDEINRKWGPLDNMGEPRLRTELETLVNAVLRESALGVPEVRDVVVIESFTDHTDFRKSYQPSEDEIARRVNDRILINERYTPNGYYDSSYVGSGGDTEYVVTETYKYAYYGHVTHKPLPRRGGRKP